MRLYRLTVEPNPWGKGPWIADKEFEKNLEYKNVGCLYFSDSKDIFTEWISWLPDKHKTVYLWEFYIPGCKIKKEGYLEYILPVEFVKANTRKIKLVEIIHGRRRRLRKKGRRKPSMKVKK